MPQNPQILSDDYMLAIGRLVVACSEIEVVVTDLTASLGNMEILVCVTLTYHQQITSKIDNLLALVRMQFGEDVKDQDIKDLIASIQRAKEIVEYRNGIVHTIWFADKSGAIIRNKFTSRGRLERKQTPTPLSEILEYAAEGFAIAQKLEEFRISSLGSKQQSVQ